MTKIFDCQSNIEESNRIAVRRFTAFDVPRQMRAFRVFDATGTLVQVYDATANKRTDYIPGPVGALARIERDSAGAETVTYLHTDHQGTARAGTGSDGLVKWEDFHTPFGDSLIAPRAFSVNKNCTKPMIV